MPRALSSAEKEIIMGLFDKKYCDVCGNKISLLGNRKLEDGNLCKDCAAKLSPWFSGRRHSMLADIKSQLDEREKNKAAVASFVTSRTFGKGSEKLYIDEDHGNFAVCYESDWKNGNPDIIPLSLITSCETNDEESKDEKKYKDKEGNMVSYNPPQYDYYYDFYCEIGVNHPYIDEIRFKLNSNEVKAETTGAIGMASKRALNSYYTMCDEIREYMMNAKNGNFAASKPREIPAEEPAAPTGPWTCPACGGENSGKFCEFCGSKRP